MYGVSHKYAIVSPKKMGVVAQLIQGEHVDDAIRMLQFTPKKAAGILQKIIKTAKNNAAQAGIDTSSLCVSEVSVGRAPKFKRMRAVSRGRGHRYITQRSHVRVVLSPVQH